ncbi:MAG: 3-hydroxybutyryl-CoA dehydrogenase [Dehalococcoidales bacterium]|nr:3-hydroxybutyryl-CoA dehydrogenase [Dehalococcoidales bacterium]
MEIKKIGVIGCGLMGGGIVQTAAQAGYDVKVSEANDALLEKGLNAIKSILGRNVEKGKMTKNEMDVILSRIKGTTKISDFSDRDLVIEAITENLELKKKLFAELDKICPPGALLATNTSCLSIIDMAMMTKRADKVLGIHFFNPVPLMKLVEVVKTIATSAETIAAGRQFGEKMGKKVVIAQDCPGFIVNRLVVPFMLNAVRMLDSGVATKEDIDAAINLGLNHPMGPLTLADLVGLDTALFIANAMYAELKDPQYAAPSLLSKMVTAGWLGRKSGKGFYEYK